MPGTLPWHLVLQIYKIGRKSKKIRRLSNQLKEFVKRLTPVKKKLSAINL
jgi:hypothetical protein